jgi:outer membrane protein assembly factor BamB
MNRRSCIITSAGLLVIAILPLSASDWPQWRGPARNGVSAEKGLNANVGSARKVWTAKVGEGWSSIAVVGNRVYTAGWSNGQDTIWCLDAATGKPAWRWSYPCSEGDYGGPRATPTVTDGKVYIMSREGGVACLNAQTGKVVWGRNVAKETGADMPQWGFTGSPLVEGNVVIFNIGATGTALDKATGRIVWKSGGMGGYSSPAPYTMGSQRAVALFSSKSVEAVNPVNGAVLWQHPWETNFDVNAADPIFAGTDVFISSNYGRGCALLRPTGNRAQIVWENRSMKNHFSTCVMLNGGIFGNDDGRLKCLELRTGKELWSARGGLGKGGLITADNKLIALTERGEVVIVQATPDRYTEVARSKVLDGTCWTPPVLANGFIYGRSHEGDLVCVDVRGK